MYRRAHRWFIFSCHLGWVKVQFVKAHVSGAQGHLRSPLFIFAASLIDHFHLGHKEEHWVKSYYYYLKCLFSSIDILQYFLRRITVRALRYGLKIRASIYRRTDISLIVVYYRNNFLFN